MTDEELAAIRTWASHEGHPRVVAVVDELLELRGKKTAKAK